MPDISLIGNAIIDVIAKPIDRNIFKDESSSVDSIKLTYGGDALNECVILSRFGKQTELISKVGGDEAGSKILEFLDKNKIITSKIIIDSNVETSINLVLVDSCGERFFISNPSSSQRQLSKDDIICQLESTGEIISFASMFISPLLDIPAMTELFKTIKTDHKKIVSVDVVRAKNGLTLRNLDGLLPYVDFIMPNEEEISALTGTNDICKNANALLDAGCSCVIIKRGKNGCYIKSKSLECHIPAYPVKNCIDTTGAGDSFAAGFLWALSEHWTIPDCGCFGTAVASCSIEHMGATDGVHSIDEALSRFDIVKNMMLHKR